MYEQIQAIFERLNDENIVRPGINPAAPAEIKSQPEAANWTQEDFIDYKNYFMVRTGSFSKLGKSHEAAIEYCKKNGIR
jgi:hypothetical protein